MAELLPISAKKGKKYLHYWKRCSIVSECRTNGVKWLVGQAVKTSPSHGENRGSIPLLAVDCFLTAQPERMLEIILRMVYSIFYAMGNYGPPQAGRKKLCGRPGIPTAQPALSHYLRTHLPKSVFLYLSISSLASGRLPAFCKYSTPFLISAGTPSP